MQPLMALNQSPRIHGRERSSPYCLYRPCRPSRHWLTIPALKEPLGNRLSYPPPTPTVSHVDEVQAVRSAYAANGLLNY